MSKINLKKLKVLLLIVVCFISVLVVFLGKNSNAVETNNRAPLELYYSSKGEFKKTNNMKVFLSKARKDLPIEVVLNLSFQFEESDESRKKFNHSSTKEEVDSYIEEKREKTRQYFIIVNNEFLNKTPFTSNSLDYKTTISEFSPHIILTFRNLETFKRFSDEIISLRSLKRLNRIIVAEKMNYYNALSIVENYSLAPGYPIKKVREDVLIIDDNHAEVSVNYRGNSVIYYWFRQVLI